MTAPSKRSELQKRVWCDYQPERVERSKKRLHENTPPLKELVIRDESGNIEVRVKLTDTPSSQPFKHRQALDGFMYDLRASRAQREVWEEEV